MSLGNFLMQRICGSNARQVAVVLLVWMNHAAIQSPAIGLSSIQVHSWSYYYFCEKNTTWSDEFGCSHTNRHGLADWWRTLQFPQRVVWTARRTGRFEDERRTNELFDKSQKGSIRPSVRNHCFSFTTFLLTMERMAPSWWWCSDSWWFSYFFLM